jgi:flagellar hook assembly protein FlgD
VRLSLYDQVGKAVASWDFPAGSSGGRKGGNETPWDGSNASGEKVRQGMYYLRMEARPVDCKMTARLGVKR